MNKLLAALIAAVFATGSFAADAVKPAAATAEPMKAEAAAGKKATKKAHKKAGKKAADKAAAK